MRSRPAGYGHCPDNRQAAEWDDPDKLYPFGFVSYHRKLTQDELYKWEMDPVSENAYQFKIGDKVLVNDIDPATISGFDLRGRYLIDYTETGASGIPIDRRNVAEYRDPKPTKKLQYTAAISRINRLEEDLKDIDLPDGITREIAQGAIEVLRLIYSQAGKQS